MDRSTRIPAATIAIGEVDWDRFAVTHTATRPSALFANLVTARTETDPESAALGQRLAALPDTERAEVLLKLVIKHVAAVSGHAAEAIPMNQPFRELGLDSLASIQLRNRVNAETGLRLATTVVYEHPTPSTLARHLNAGLDELRPSGGAQVVAQLRQLESTLSELPSESAKRQEIGALLEGILNRWRQSDRVDLAPELDLDEASDDEMFDFIDDVLGNGEE
jgi:acyl carrier protein